LAEQVLETMRGWIFSGLYPPGTRLRVRDVAARVGTSPMPVREAISRLEESGLVIREPYKGATVRGLNIDELEHAYDVRILLEGDAARAGANAADDDTVERMAQHWGLLQEAAASGRVTDALAHDEQLLLALYAAGGNEILAEVIRGLWDRCRPYKFLWASFPAEQNSGIEIWRYKPELIEAARRHDGRAAQQILKRSYREAQVSLRHIISRISEVKS